MDGRKLVAWNLRRIRVSRGLSQEALAADAEGGLENPTVGILDKLARALSAPISEFFVVPPTGFVKISPLPGGPTSVKKRRPKSVKRS